ncbi:exopolysaccharide Pel transporter PelG [Metabacillus litoralis]|uniref:exopolysaccharide Pel transporter PelG n=1 Tax=Metabacillus litoralis TaxID=152268 RepID=UPI0020425C58|nr:exopolysaccharide Pel transporter PelG [Metabacillus litoralis]MCM3162219.1 exopolysaccharide Pel transporter PelG [Metabacillus litoralis]MCM3410303.1 exopolysaccharide Pel transporter PelG [Metabacillus litoralis]
MAGIGFQLQKLFKEDYFSSRLKAYGFSVLVTSGPWLIIILSLSLTQWIIGNIPTFPIETRELLTISLSYCFIFSQLIFSVQQLTLTRYLADQLYEVKYERVIPSYLGLTKTSLLLAIILFFVFLILSPLPIYLELIIGMFFMIMLLIWNTFMFITALKDYKSVSTAFLIGGLVIVLGELALAFVLNFDKVSVFQGVSILYIPFILGMFLTLSILFVVLSRTFAYKGEERPLEYLTYVDYFPRFVVIGTLYTAGLWIANFVIWFGEGSSQLYDVFLFNRMYDVAVFWSYLTIIPTLMFFVISVETRFYDRYRSFYGYINEGGSLEQILRSKDRMITVLKEEVFRLLRNQGVVTVLFLICASWIGSWLNASPEFVPMLRLTIVGAYFNAMILVFQLLLLYFEDHKGAMIISILFFGSILLLSIAFLPMGISGYGLSFCIGSIIAFIYSSLRLITFIKHVDYFAFTQGQMLQKAKLFVPLVKKLYKY